MDLTFGLITVSDTCYTKEKADTAGPELQSELSKTFPNSKMFSKIVKDCEETIGDALLDYSDFCNVIFTIGGTGFSPRDVTPEATRSFIDREAPGIAYAMISRSLLVTEMAMLSRAVCGTRGGTLVVNLPGSTKAAKECFGFIKSVIPHAVELLTDKKDNIEKTHKIVQNVPDESKQSKVKINNPASRKRKSPYAMVEEAEASSIILKECSPTTETEVVPFEKSLNRVLAEDILAANPFPPFSASIKDGYAVRTDDGIGKRKVRSVAAAGDQPGAVDLRPGEVIRISTGAPVPPGADAVVQVEDTTLITTTQDGSQEEEINIDVEPKKGQDIRPIGSDVSEGSVILEKYDAVTAFHIGVLAMIGKTEVKVFKRPSIGIISTGNELKDPRETLKPGQIRDCNRRTLIHLLERYGYNATDCGIARDRPNEVKNKLEKSFSDNDVIISSGGVSMGEFDLLKEVLVQDFGAMIHFGRINVKPGKPTTFATLVYQGKLKIIFGLPGNPVSCSVTCLLFVIPTIRYLERNKHFQLPRVAVELQEARENHDTRPEYIRVKLNFTSDGKIVAKSTGNQISSRLNSMVGAQGLLLLPGKIPATSFNIPQKSSNIPPTGSLFGVPFKKYTTIVFDNIGSAL